MTYFEEELKSIKEKLVMRIVFGIFRDGKLIKMLGQPAEMTINQAELIAELFDSLNDNLPDGDYFAYDYAESHNC